MRGFYFLAALAAALLAPSVKAQEKVEKLDSIVVSASRAGKATPVTYTMNSLPMTLNLQPSVVTSVEGGTGLGYSKLTIRGSKGSQINVTLNGITLNDAESQEVFWVNIPALTSLLSSVQVQRGLGTSANGAGAFGASINMSTASVGAEPTGRMELSFGSFGTFIATASASTGLLPGGWYAQGAYSRGYTKGYIRNAKADVQSALAVIGKMWENNSFRLTWLMGEQHTGITWLGISREQMEKDRTYNPAGAYYDALGNEFYYDNETDNYCQHHLQANFTHRFPGQLTWSTTLNFTKGDGYFENYMDDAMPETFGIGVQPSYSSDFIVRQEMDNSYSVLNSTLTSFFLVPQQRQTKRGECLPPFGIPSLVFPDGLCGSAVPLPGLENVRSGRGLRADGLRPCLELLQSPCRSDVDAGSRAQGLWQCGPGSSRTRS